MIATLNEVGDDRVRVVIEGRVVGPVLTRRAAKVIMRWLNEGALDDMSGNGPSDPSGIGKLGHTIAKVDQAWDAVRDLFRDGLR